MSFLKEQFPEHLVKKILLLSEGQVPLLAMLNRGFEKWIKEDLQITWRVIRRTWYHYKNRRSYSYELVANVAGVPCKCNPFDLSIESDEPCLMNILHEYIPNLAVAEKYIK